MIVFRSAVGPDIMMFDEWAHRLMAVMEKEQGARGVVTVEQLPAAIARLKAAVAQNRAHHAPPGVAAGAEGDTDGEDGPEPPVSLAQRALPLIELLEISLARGKPVTWGV